jgi:hypothetical protein
MFIAAGIYIYHLFFKGYGGQKVTLQLTSP